MKSFNKRLRHSHGFTLVEVMVAVAIFAIAGGAIMKAVYEHVRSIATLESVTYATWVANNELTRTTLESKYKWPLDKEKKGESEMAGRTWYWTRESVKTADESLYQITVIVATDEEMKNTVTSVTTFLTKVQA